ncbi:MAG: hypothetical protein F6K14_07665 [Symploca sp. SIO2C1]|nr:hypothetical protein [Symploca sp. SIO2C1]
MAGHPDYEQFLDDLGATLPTECRVSRVPYAESYRCDALKHDSVVFGLVNGMSILLRLPDHAHTEALSSGGSKASTLSQLSQEWIDVTRIKNSDQLQLVKIAYDYACELAKPSNQTLPSDKEITTCPNCAQKLRAPSHLGELKLTCPKCKHNWLWSPTQS